MKTIKYLFFLCFVALLFVGLSGCDSDNNGDDDPEIDLGPVLTNVGPNVIVATYRDLDAAAAALLNSINTLAATPTDANLQAARSAWVTTRAPWEASEGFLFGPVDQFGLDPALDTWPVDEIIIQSILDGSDAITPEFVANQDVDSGLKGFHVIEFLLYGDQGSKTAGDITAREFDYLTAAAEVLDDDASQLFTSWDPSGDNFVANVTQAGQAGSQFVSEKDAILTLADAVVGIADEVGAGKMQGPLDEGVVQVESRFSGNSKNDFQDNMRSIRHIYLGDYSGNSGPGLTDVVRQLDAALDTRVISEIDASIAAIGAIPGDFRDAITANRAAVESAIDAVITLKTTLEEMTARLEEGL